MAFRALTGAGIGGEYAAINSAIDELIPARIRGHVDLVINSTFWIGAALGSGVSLWLLRPGLFPVDRGWRLAFGIGAVVGLLVLFLRRHVPESPRWLMIHGEDGEAHRVVEQIEKHVAPRGSLPEAEYTIDIEPRKETRWREIWDAAVHRHRKQSILGFTLMVTQAFFYNAVLFPYGLVLLRYYRVPAEKLGVYLVPLAIANFVGPVFIGRWFDTLGRRRMIAGTYILSGALLLIAAWGFLENRLSLRTLPLIWMAVLFVASSAASSAYLTVSEIFPLEIRGLAIVFFYACGTLLGGVGGPALFGYLVGTGSKTALFFGYAAGAVLMIAGGCTEAVIGVDAERKALERISAPLSEGT